MNHFSGMAAGILLLISAGCTAPVSKEEVKQEPVVLKKADLSVMRPRCENFVQAMTRSLQSGNFADWRTVLEKEGAPGKPLAVDESKFQIMCRSLKASHGTLVKCSFLGELDQDLCRDFLWILSFRTAQGKSKEELFAIRCAAFSGTPAIAGFGFRFFNNPRSPKK